MPSGNPYRHHTMGIPRSFIVRARFLHDVMARMIEFRQIGSTLLPSSPVTRRTKNEFMKTLIRPRAFRRRYHGVWAFQPHHMQAIFLSNSPPLDDSATVDPALPTNMGYSAFLLQMSEKGDQYSLAFFASPSRSLQYPTLPTPLPLPPCSPEPYPSDGPVTRSYASQRVNWPDELMSWMFRYLSMNLDA